MAILIDGNVGSIELDIRLPDVPAKAIAVISHPHPLYGGTMDNKVVATVAKACVLSKIIAVRHQFRGVGQTEGRHGDGVGELSDTLSVIAHAQQEYPELPLIITGFSFGAAMSIQAAIQYPQALLLAIAPPIYPAVLEIDFIPNKWHMLMGEEDEVVAVEDVKQWLHDQQNPAVEHWFEGASHFFHGKLIDLRKTLVKILENTVN